MIILYLKQIYKNLTLFIFLTLLSLLFSNLYNSENYNDNLFTNTLKFSNSMMEIKNLDPSLMYRSNDLNAASNSYLYFNFMRNFIINFDHKKFCDYKKNPKKELEINFPGVNTNDNITELGEITIYFNYDELKKSDRCLKKIFNNLQEKENEIYLSLYKQVYQMDWFVNDDAPDSVVSDQVVIDNSDDLKLIDFKESFTKRVTVISSQDSVINQTLTLLNQSYQSEILSSLNKQDIAELEDYLEKNQNLNNNTRTSSKLLLNFIPMEIISIKSNIDQSGKRTFQTFIIFFIIFNSIGIFLLFVNKSIFKLKFIK